MNIKAIIAVIGIFLGCCSNVIFLELLVKFDPGSGNLITFSQFLFIAIEGFIFTANFGTKKPLIGLKDYFKLVCMFFITSVCNNYAFDFNIPMPLHMIFRAGSLIANMIMGVLIMKKSYARKKYISVMLITLGIVICTIVSGTDVNKSPLAEEKDSNMDQAYSKFFWWTLGIGLLTFALLISAAMGLYQEVLYKTYGKHPKEALFYTHLLPLPGFCLLYTNISDHLSLAWNSDLMSLSFFNIIRFSIPIIIFYLICNMLTQYVCIRSVYILTTECSSLTVTLVLTLRKFVSLLFSIVYFRNSFTVWHWIGTFLVFIGTAIFTEIMPGLQSSKSNQIKKQS